jgi:hypothetical protein
MKLTKPVKIILGLATAFNILSPILGIIVWFTAVFSAVLGMSDYQGEPTWLFFVFFFLFFPLILLATLSSLVLLPVYLIHIIKNQQAKEIYRILSAIGLHFLPWLAMPFYFLVYIWPENPPDWALAEPVSVPPAPPVKPKPEPEMTPATTSPAEMENLSEPAAPQEPDSEPEIPPEALAPLDATVVSWERPSVDEPAGATVVSLGSPAEEQVDSSTSEGQPGEKGPAADALPEDELEGLIRSGDAPMHPDMAAIPGPEEQPARDEPASEPAPKTRRKRLAKPKAKPPEETSASPDVTLIGPSPVEEEPSDEN